MEVVLMYGVIVLIMIEYGDEKMIHHQIIDERIKVILQKDSDHVLNDGMYLVHENGDF